MWVMSSEHPPPPGSFPMWQSLFEWVSFSHSMSCNQMLVQKPKHPILMCRQILPFIPPIFRCKTYKGTQHSNTPLLNSWELDFKARRDAEVRWHWVMRGLVLPCTMQMLQSFVPLTPSLPTTPELVRVSPCPQHICCGHHYHVLQVCIMWVMYKEKSHLSEADHAMNGWSDISISLCPPPRKGEKAKIPQH